MSGNKINIKQLIQEYLLDEGISITKIPDPKLEFGFSFFFPPGNLPNGMQRGKSLNVLKPKGKQFIIFSIGTQIGDAHIHALNSLEAEKKNQFFLSLRKITLLKNLMLGLDVENNRFQINEQYFLRKDKIISKNTFFKNIRRILTCTEYCIILLNEYCAGKVKMGDLSDPSFKSDFSLYS